MSFSTKHNKNSVKPIAVIDLEDYDEKIAVTIVNSGTGPLIVKELSCKNKVTGVHAPDLIMLMPEIDQKWTATYQNIAEDTIGVGKEGKLIELNPKNNEIRQKIRVALKDISICLTYLDVYGTNFTKKQDLAFFGRNIGSRKDAVA